MTAPDPTLGARSSRDGATFTDLPSTDSLQTRLPCDDPKTSFEFGGSTDSYATAHPDASPTADRDFPPDAFPGYELLEKIGQGGMAIVYKARQEGLNRLVAFKMILGGHRAGPKDLIRFLVEAEAVASIKHPNVVQVHEYGEADDRPFLAMEYLPGGTLADRLKREGRIAPQPAAELVAKLARAVQAAHDQEIVHRDLKPANVLFDAQGEPKVTDFGLAKRTTGIDHTQTQAVMGTPAYMSPEQAQGKSKFVGPQADVYALGVILYECLTGTRPFVHEDTRVLLVRVMADDPDPPSKHVPGLPRDLELIALKCLEKEPEERYPTAAALAKDLTHFTAGEPVSVRAASTIEQVLRWARRKPTQAAAYALSFAVVVLLAFGASLAVLWWQAEGARETAEIAKTNAETAREGEEKERKNAESARDAEKKARGEVVIAKDKLERVEYGRTMQVAHQEWRDSNVIASLALLDGTRADLREWEWKYVQNLWHGESLELRGYTEEVTSVWWSPDGSRITTFSSEDEETRVLDARTGAKLFTLEGRILSVSWSPDSSRIATTANDDETARVWDARSGAELLKLKGRGGVESVSWSPDGSRVAAACGDHTARVWDARSGAEMLTLKGHTYPVNSASWSPDGSRIATASNDDTVRVWDARSGAEVLLKRHAKSVYGASWSPDGSRIASHSDDDNFAQVWDARSGADLFTLKGHTNELSSASWSPDGSRIATTASDDETARVWDARSGAELLTLKGRDAVTSVSWSPDGSFIATTARYDETARIWDARSGVEVLGLKGHTSAVNDVSWSPDGSRIATASSDKTVRVWDARSDVEALTINSRTKRFGSSLWDPDGARTANAPPRVTARAVDAIFSVEALALSLRALTQTFVRGAFSRRAGLPVSWSPDGTRIVTAPPYTTEAWVCDARSGAEVLTFKGHTSWLYSASWSPDGSRIATASSDKSARVWDARSGAELLALNGHTGEVNSVSWSPDGSRIATASDDRTARVWDARNGSEVLTLKGHTLPVNSVSWSPDGSRIATGSNDKTVRVWDARSGSEVLTLKGHTGGVYSVSWSPDGSRIATASHDKTARVWDARSRAELRAAGR
jgi:WD40 repeat protein/tRNA A-37 threonylcarbamoyl transferase component Bud32